MDVPCHKFKAKALALGGLPELRMAIHRRLSHHNKAGRIERVDKLAGPMDCNALPRANGNR